ncbi:MAG: glutamate-5-semialdehyde dehydrogenase [Phycisphaerae bacterium]|nr:glutamate-5-semialdehyde dehydrogenase [Phycisphaerae bacterium]
MMQIAKDAKNASIAMAKLSSKGKDGALTAIANAIRANAAKIIKANEMDLTKAKADDISDVLYKRLKFDEAKIAEVCAGIESLIALGDPIGEALSKTELDDGFILEQVRCPIGVLGIVFESRPDALVQISALALKSSNAVLLKGGSEARNTNRVLAEIIYEAGVGAGVPDGWLGLLEDRSDVAAMLSMSDYIDLIIPRGSNEFVKYIMDNTNISVMGHADGICHVFIDKDADEAMAVDVAFDSKCQYPAVCNAMETLLVHKDIAAEVLPDLAAKLAEADVEIRGDENVRGVIDCGLANEEDWRTEYNDFILAIKIVNSLEDAISHINKYGSGHTDAIVTGDESAANRFMQLVDSADVFWNCSTRFADGFRFGLGAEVGVSTGKIHARGPVGLEGLTIYKWKLIGNGQTVAMYSGKQGRKYKHRKLR